MKRLPASFYQSADVISISRELLGKFLFTNIDKKLSGGMITETEAYRGITDRASHAFGNRRTARTEIMFGQGGQAYVYLCYGIHSLFNVVTNKSGIPEAVLVRAVMPTHGIPIMEKRRGKKAADKSFSGGPGTVSSALGIHYSHSGSSLHGNEIWIEDKGIQIPSEEILAGPRIGVDYAGEDALLPYRFRISPSFIKSLQLDGNVFK